MQQGATRTAVDRQHGIVASVRKVQVMIVSNLWGGLWCAHSPKFANDISWAGSLFSGNLILKPPCSMTNLPSAF